MKTKILPIIVMACVAYCIGTFAATENTPSDLTAAFDHLQADGEVSGAVLDPFVLFYKGDLLKAVPDQYLEQIALSSSRNAQLHALFLLARKGDDAALSKLNALAEKEDQTEEEQGILAYAYRAGLLRSSDASRDDVSVMSVPALLDHIASLNEGGIPRTQAQEMGEAKNVIDRRVLLCAPEALASLDVDRLNQYVASGNERAHIHALFLLARLGDEDALAEVKWLAKNADNGFVRQGAVYILGMIQKESDPEILPILKAALNDPFTYMVGDVEMGVGADAALQYYGKRAVWTNGAWVVIDAEMHDSK
ncbi:MAG: HEAT repeat domain-containing protein [Verrucomicrobia bacterium]|nr:HEAT repeat domain-containing protein [Kiritimatiellia bacterium]MCP5488664.1 HEAT repeat domain-containing protein [Verrucomicrobiota bacterium]